MPRVKTRLLFSRAVFRQVDGQYLYTPGTDELGKRRPLLLVAALAVDEQPNTPRLLTIQNGGDMVNL